MNLETCNVHKLLQPCQVSNYQLFVISSANNNLLLTEREGRTGEYWPEVVAVRTERSEVRTNTTEGQYSPVRLEIARLVSSLLYGIWAMLVLNLPASENKITHLMTVPRKRSVWRNPDQERTNQNARIACFSRYIACGKMNQDVAYARSTEGGCKCGGLIQGLEQIIR